MKFNTPMFIRSLIWVMIFGLTDRLITFINKGRTKLELLFMLIVSILLLIYMYYRNRFGSTLEVFEDGVAIIFLGRRSKSNRIPWDKMVEVGIGTCKILGKESKWIYFSTTRLTEEQINNLQRVLQDEQCFKIKYSDLALVEIRKYYHGEIKNLPSEQPQSAL